MEEMQFQFGTPKQEIDEPSDFLMKQDALTTKYWQLFNAGWKKNPYK